MKNCILGKKLGMTQLIQEDGNVEPVTVIEAGPCTVIEKKTTDKHGYDALVLGYVNLKEKKQNNPIKGHYKRVGVEPKRYVKEFRVDDTATFEEKSELTVEQFEVDQVVNVRSRSIGKGFAGTIKRHNFSRGPMTHGSKNHRLPGSIGGGTDPGRVIKGTRMGGHMGDRNVTVANLKVLKIDSEKNLLFIKGAVPGKKNNVVEIVG